MLKFVALFLIVAFYGWLASFGELQRYAFIAAALVFCLWVLAHILRMIISVIRAINWRWPTGY